MKKYVQFFALKNSGNVVGIMSEFAKKNSYFLIIFTIFATFDERFSFWFNLTTTWLENPDFGSKSRFWLKVKIFVKNSIFDKNQDLS